MKVQATAGAVAGAPRPRSRRQLLAAGLAGMAGTVAATLGRPPATEAAAGDPLVLGTTNFAGTAATRLNATSSGGAFWMTQFGSGSGVRGEATTGTGGIFLTAAPNHYALVGQHTTSVAGAGAAVQAIGGHNRGIEATTDTADIAILATNHQPTGGTVAVYGTLPSPDGRAVFGFASSSTGLATGVAGTSQSSSGIGVHGESTGSGTGVLGDSAATAVSAHSNGTSGVALFANASASTGLTYGVFTQVTSASGWALWAVGNAKINGNLDVTGTITAPATLARMAHPLDAAKVVDQEAVVSAERLMIQSGTTTAGSDGDATIRLPAWFGAAARELRYHLTPLGSFAPVYVKAKLLNDRFVIGGAGAGQEVSWQVSGVRSDVWSKDHPLLVEHQDR